MRTLDVKINTSPAARQVWVLVAGELTRDCIADMRELYGLPPKDCDSAELLLDLYEEVLLYLAVVARKIVDLRALRFSHDVAIYEALHSLTPPIDCQ